MPRGGISFEGIGFHATTFKAGAGIKALVATGGFDDRTGLPLGKDLVKDLPVVITASGTVDFGTDGDTVFGFIDVYEPDGYVSIQDAGYRTYVPTVTTAPTVGKMVAVDGAGKVKDAVGGAGVKQQMIKKVTTKATTGGTATVTILATGSTALASGKAISVTLDTTSTTTNATSIRDALSADTDVTAYFVVGGTETEITLTRKVASTAEIESFDFALGTAVAATMSATVMIDGVAADNKSRSPIFVEVDSTAKTATVYIG